MKIFTQNSEVRLYEKAKELKDRPHASWRCVYLNLADRYHYLLRNHFIGTAIVQRLSDADGYIYFCGDGDIMILFQGQLRPVLGKLGAHVDGLQPEQLLKASDANPFIIYDLGTQWQQFYHLCRNKCFQAELRTGHVAAPFAYRQPVGNLVLDGVRE